MRPGSSRFAAPTVLALLVGCAVQIASAPGLACDGEHDCSDGRVCWGGRCLDAGDVRDAGARCDRTRPCPGEQLCFGARCLEPGDIPGDGGRCDPRRIAGQPENASNTSFEQPGMQWSDYSGGVIARVDGGLDGEFALRVGRASGTRWGVESAKAGWFDGGTRPMTPYCFEAWVRAIAPTAGTIELRLNERIGPDDTVGPNEDVPRLVGQEWTRIAGERVLLSVDGGHTPHWQVYSEDVVTFEIDAFSLKAAAAP